MKKVLILLLVISILTSCKEKKEPKESVEVPTATEMPQAQPEINAFTNSIELAHKKEAFLSNDAVAYDFTVSFGGNTLLDGKITQKTDGSMVRIDNKDGSVIVFDGDKVYANNVDVAANPMTRFHIFTWSYFFAMPYKLNDPGTQWSSEEMLTYGDTKYPTSRLSFENGVGDTSEDWYVVYKDPKTNVLDGVAYIVSFGKSVEAAEEEPHFAKYEDLTVVDGVPFATKWSFHNWNKEDGYTDQIGEASITNIKFTETPATFYAQPENGVVAPMPGK
ncbi:DUF6503 family protein [uncultured Nonlabens sp.]|uniref:DUF6503 family protein n=1 Tax=uncultured Nonlabens sp. TaxID=859306 RepID=UPI00261DDADB|nr:DUF6503 family protein [uncultured Nonlabens sp.]